ncbi:Bifunctional purine biosynthesis protein PurH, partial [Spiromyces aspiralis]
MWSNLFTVAGSLVLATSTTFAQIIVGRFIMGLQTGMASSTISAYIGEITTPKARTTLGSLLQSSVTIGIFLALTISLGLSKPPLWRILLGLSGIVGLASMLMFRNAVESPRWLVNNGREDEARQSLQSLRRGADIDAELEDYRNLAKSSAAVFAPSPSTNRSKPGFISPRGATIMDILLNRTPHNLRHQLLVVTCLMIFQQFSGINAI